MKKTTGARQNNYAPVDGVLEARWDGRDVVATLTVDENERLQNAARKKERKTGHVRGLVLAKVPLADLLAGRPLAWNASGELDVADLELAPLPLPMNLRGALTGRVKLRDLTGTPVLDARARVDDFGIAGVRVLRADLRMEAKNGSLVGSARVNQEDGGNGRMNITSSSLKWSGSDVDWDAAQPTRIDYTLDRMRLAILRPFVRRSIPEIDGVVDGRGSATVDATSHVFEGGVSLTSGRLYVNAIGEEVTDVSAIARFERDGAFRIQDATARIGSGEVKASAAGRMNGLRFESVDVVAVVPSKDGIPLSSEGATFAQANGEVRLSAKMAADRRSLAVNVTVPRAKVTVPTRGTQKLQSLEPDKSIDIGVRQSDGRLVAPALRPGEARRKVMAAATADAAAAAGAVDGIDGIAPSDDLLARFTVLLADDVQLEGRGVRIYLTGRTIVDLGNEIAVTGQIALRQGGTIDVQGRKFIVDHGTVSFARADDPADPIVIAAAYWDAPDRTRIWVEFNGPLKTGKLTLRSEPAFSKNEILSIMLFGRADPNQGRAGDARPSDTQAATDVRHGRRVVGAQSGARRSGRGLRSRAGQDEREPHAHEGRLSPAPQPEGADRLRRRHLAARAGHDVSLPRVAVHPAMVADRNARRPRHIDPRRSLPASILIRSRERPSRPHERKLTTPRNPGVTIGAERRSPKANHGRAGHIILVGDLRSPSSLRARREALRARPASDPHGLRSRTVRRSLAEAKSFVGTSLSLRDEPQARSRAGVRNAVSRWARASHSETSREEAHSLAHPRRENRREAPFAEGESRRAGHITGRLTK